MIVLPAVTVVVNGAVAASSAPARLAGGRVVAPLRPIVVRLTSQVTYDPDAGSVDVVRGSTHVRVSAAFVDDGVPYVELAPLVKALGGSVSFDSPTKTLNVTLPSDGAIVTPAPFDPAQPQVSPTAVFTPAPPRATPRAPDSGAPRPRRTAIPVLPSQPQSPPAPASTGPRR
jgi:hypothetical protein